MLIIICLFIGQTFDVGRWFGIQSTNGFIGYGLGLQDILLFIIFLSVIGLGGLLSITINKLSWKIISAIILLSAISFIQIILSHTDPESLLAGIKVLSCLVLWVYIFVFYWKKIYFIFWIILLLFSLFDHFILSATLPVVFVWMIIDKIEIIKPIFIKFWLWLNILTGFYQFIVGKSFGLKILGEQILTDTQYNIATIRFHNWETLRSYGLTLHPNILGFLLVTYLAIQIKKNNLFYKDKFTDIALVALTILTFSRVAIFSLIVILVFYFLKSAKFHKINVHYDSNFLSKFKVFLPPLLLLIILITTTTRTESDKFRITDIETFYNTYSTLSNSQKTLGLGLGQYPIYLKNNNSDFATWQYQPVHNAFLNLFIELGILPLLLMIIVIFYPQGNFYKSLKYKK